MNETVLKWISKEFKCEHNFLALMVHDFIYFLGTFSIDTSETAQIMNDRC